MLCYLLPVIFSAGSLQYVQVSSENPSSSLWEYGEGSNRTYFLGPSGNNSKTVTEKSFSPLNSSRRKDQELALESQVMRDREDSSSLRIKRSNQTGSETCLRSSIRNVTRILNPIMYSIVVLLGLLFNGVLLHIFYKHDELRTQRNALFINLAISDALFIVAFCTLQIVSKMQHLETRCFHSDLCRAQVFCICIWASIGAYSIALISIQRYLRVVKFTKPIVKRYVKIFVKPASLIATVWTLSIVLAIPEVARSRITSNVFKCSDPSLFVHGSYPFVLYGIIPFSTAAVFYWAVQRRPLPERLGNEFSKRDRPERILLSLGFVYVITYVPVLICDILKADVDPKPTEIYCYISKCLHLLNPVLCPIALCFASSRVRMYFIRHLLCTCICSGANNCPGTTFSVSECRGTTSRVDCRSSAREMTVFKETQGSTKTVVSVL